MQKLQVAYRCIVCSTVKHCAVNGEMHSCDSCDYCYMLDDDYHFEIENGYCVDCMGEYKHEE